MERRGREQFVREISTQNWQDGPTLPATVYFCLSSLFRYFNFLAATGTDNKLGFCAIVSPALTWLSRRLHHIYFNDFA